MSRSSVVIATLSLISLSNASQNVAKLVGSENDYYYARPPEIPLDTAIAMQANPSAPGQSWPAQEAGVPLSVAQSMQNQGQQNQAGNIQVVPLSIAQQQQVQNIPPVSQQGQWPPPQQGIPQQAYPDWQYPQPQPPDYSMYLDQYGAPCDYQEPCGEPENVAYVTVCDLDVCKRNCKEHFGYDEGACFNDECYCKKKEPKQPWQWNYENQNEWQDHFPKCELCPHHQQSPVNIDDEMIKNLSGDIELVNYGVNISLIVENTGHGVRMFVQTSGPDLPALKVLEDVSAHGGVEQPHKNMSKHHQHHGKQIQAGTYVLGHIDLHWGRSEHSINSKSENVEMQLVHFDLNQDHVERALEQDGSVLVLSLLFRSDKTKTDWNAEAVMTVLDEIIDAQSETTVKPDDHISFVPKILGQEFGLYHGSMTQPPCQRTVFWLVSTAILDMKSSQIRKLQKLKDLHGDPILANARNVQKRN